MKKANKKKLSVHVVQYEQGGIPYEPYVYFDLKDAENKYVKIVNNIFGKRFKKYKSAEAYL